VSDEFARLRAMVSQPETWNLNARDVNALRDVLSACDARGRRVRSLEFAVKHVLDALEEEEGIDVQWLRSMLRDQ
jgi:hypothetical protein